MSAGPENSACSIVQKPVWSVESWKYMQNSKFLKKAIQDKGNKQRGVMSH